MSCSFSRAPAAFDRSRGCIPSISHFTSSHFCLSSTAPPAELYTSPRTIRGSRSRTIRQRETDTRGEGNNAFATTWYRVIQKNRAGLITYQFAGPISHWTGFRRIERMGLLWRRLMKRCRRTGETAISFMKHTVWLLTCLSAFTYFYVYVLRCRRWKLFPLNVIY